jgi:hypothetical protein
MTSDHLTRWLAIGGNAAVVIGLLLLVYELNQTRELTRAQMRSEISSGIYDLLAMTANNDQLADLMLRADTGEPLTDAEYFQYACSATSRTYIISIGSAYMMTMNLSGRRLHGATI